MRNDERFNRAAKSTVDKELSFLEKKIMSDLAAMILEAHTKLSESDVFPKFKKRLNGKFPNLSDIKYFKDQITKIVLENDSSFCKYFDIVVERDPTNRASIGYEFKVKPTAFQAR